MQQIKDPSLYSMPLIEEDTIVQNHFINKNISFYEKKQIEGSVYGSNFFVAFFDPNLRVPCFVKPIHYEYDEKCDKYFRELYFLTHLKFLHPVFVEIFGWTKEFILLNNIRYNSLSTIFKNKSHESCFTPTQKSKIALGIAHALRYLHKLGIVHCDISINNILIDDNLEPKLCDFGSARYITDRPSDSGTDSFIPPEFLRKEKSCNLKSDVYSFGIVLYYLALEKCNLDLKAYNIEDRELPSINAINKDIAFLIRFCRNAHPSQRCDFDQVVRLMTNGYLFEGSNQKEVLKYYEKLENETTPISEFEP